MVVSRGRRGTPRARLARSIDHRLCTSDQRYLNRLIETRIAAKFAEIVDQRRNPIGSFACGELGFDDIIALQLILGDAGGRRVRTWTDGRGNTGDWR